MEGRDEEEDLSGGTGQSEGGVDVDEREEAVDVEE
jgi:hypothetical protein